MAAMYRWLQPSSSDLQFWSGCHSMAPAFSYCSDMRPIWTKRTTRRDATLRVSRLPASVYWKPPNSRQRGDIKPMWFNCPMINMRGFRSPMVREAAGVSEVPKGHCTPDTATGSQGHPMARRRSTQSTCWRDVPVRSPQRLAFNVILDLSGCAFACSA